MVGRPRDVELESRLLSSAWALLTTVGYDGMALTRVAADAGAHRSDVYRRWRTKAQLVVDVLAVHLPPMPEVDTGSLLGDMRAHLDNLAASWSSPWMDGLVGALADLRRDPDAEFAFLSLSERRGRVGQQTIARALARGEIAAVPMLSVMGDLLEGPLMHRRMIGRQPLTPSYLDSIAAVAHGVLVGVRESS